MLTKTCRVAARRIGAVRREKVQWLWPGWLARGVLTLIDSDPGTGKSTLAAELPARVGFATHLNHRDTARLSRNRTRI
jgi:hypothetical protein